MKQDFIGGEGFVMRDTENTAPMSETNTSQQYSEEQKFTYQKTEQPTMTQSPYQPKTEKINEENVYTEQRTFEQTQKDTTSYQTETEVKSYQQNMEQNPYQQETNTISYQQNMGQNSYQPKTEAKANTYQQRTEQTHSYGQEPEAQRVYSYSNPNYNSSQQTTNQQPKKKEKSKKSGNLLKKATLMVAGAAVFGCVAGGSFYGVNKLANNMFPEETKVSEAVVDIPEEKKVVTTTTSATTGTTVTDVTNVVQSVMPSVVSITSKTTEVAQSFFGQAYEYESEGSGSGIIVGQSDTELLIATNCHVVEGADELTIYFINDDTATAKIKGTDSDMDLAVIAVDLSEMSAETLGSISVATLGDSDALQVGEPAIAIGNALGYGQSVTTGVISALDRAVEDEESEGFIQTDAAINPGNSGGALLNIQGQVIGINSMKISSGGYTEASIEGMGYAIPISAAKPIIDELMNKVTRDKVAENDMGYLGIRGATIGDEMHEVYNMPYGIYVSEVVPGSAAEKAGLLPGDVIVKFDGTKISSYEELQNQLQYYSAGETIELIVQRPGNGAYVDQTISLTLGSRSEIDQ